jgi:hypothetical protein
LEALPIFLSIIMWTCPGAAVADPFISLQSNRWIFAEKLSE